MIVLYSTDIKKKLKKLPKGVASAFAEKFEKFQVEPFNSSLKNHPLHGERKNERSINITGDYRLIFETTSYKIVKLLDIDTHHNLYGK